MKTLSFHNCFGPKSKLAKTIRQAALAAMVITLTACDATPEAAAPPGDLLAAGARGYEMNCAQCHYDGSGTEMMPSLKGSRVVAGAAEKSINIILHGQQGVSEIDGRKIGGIMPSQAYLDDFEIAAIVTYIRSEFAGVSDLVDESEVRALR